MRKMKLIIALALIMCLVTTGAWAEDITAAIMVPLTGGGAFYGKIMRDIAYGVVDEINKEGIKGFGKINIRVYDTASDAAVTARKIERAVSLGANFIWGGFSSSVEEMMVTKANELKIPCLLTNEHTYVAIPCDDNKYAITPVLGTMEMGKICAKYFKEKKVKTYAIIGADYIYGRTWDRSLTMHLEGTGIRKVYENWHGFDKVDYSADIAKLKKLKPDAVVRSYGGSGEYVLVKQMKDAGYWPSIFIANCTMSGYQVTLDNLGEEYAVGVTAETCQDPEKPSWIEFAKSHKEKYGCWPTWLSQGAHDTLWLMKKAVETAGTLDPEVLAKVLHNVSYDGVSAYPIGPFQDFGYVKNGTIRLVEWCKGSPAWTNELGVHRETVCKLEAVPMCKEKVEQILK